MRDKFGGVMEDGVSEAIKNEAETMDIVKTGRSDEKMFRFGAFGNEGVILREAYVKELEQRIQGLETLMNAPGRVEAGRNTNIDPGTEK